MAPIEHSSLVGCGASTAARRRGSCFAALLFGLLPIAPVLVAEGAPTASIQPAAQTYGDQPPAPASTPWLDEVRAQRQAWEARRDATRSAYEARRRANNPRAAAQQEAWEEDVRRRRAARTERMDQNLEWFRSLGPGQPPPPWPWVSGMPTLPEIGSVTIAPGTPGDQPIFAPPGWDNHWYFRGF